MIGNDFVPINSPWIRRLQTICIMQWVLSYLFGGIACLFLTIILLFTRLWWIPCIYLVWYLYDRRSPETGGRASEFVRRSSVWKYGADYFPLTLHKTTDLDPRRSYIVGIHPHGILDIAGLFSFGSEAPGFSEKFPGLVSHMGATPVFFMVPLFRDYIMSFGGISVSKASFRWILSHPGHMVCLVVGGASQVLHSQSGTYNLCMLKRKGFIKQALVHGASLVPMYNFGEEDVYDHSPHPDGSYIRMLQQFLSRICGIPLGVLQVCSLVPRRTPINAWIGEPIDVVKTVNPSQAEIDDLHAKYVEQLRKLFEKHKTKYGIPEDVHLNFLP